jgi:hypothetical protein
MKKVIFFAFLCVIMACSDEDSAGNEPEVQESEIIRTYRDGDDDWFIGVNHQNAKEFDLDLDGVNDIRIINLTQFPEENHGDVTAVGYFQVKQMVYLEVLNSKLNIAIRDDDTIIIDQGSDFIKVGEEPTIANILSTNEGTIDGQLDYGNEEMNSLLYVNYQGRPFMEYNSAGQVVFNNYIFAPRFPFGSNNWVNGFFYYPNEVYRIDQPFLGQTLNTGGYIGFRLMDETNQPRYGRIDLSFYVNNYAVLNYNSSIMRWYQVTIEVESFALWNTPNLPLSVWD